MMNRRGVVTLSGSPFERGRQYGSLMKDNIIRALSVWDKSFFEKNNTTLNSYVEFIQAEEYFKSTIEEYASEYLEEVQGIAKSTGISFAMLYAWQLADEHYWLVKLFKDDLSVEEEGCSTFAVLMEHQKILMGQNLDIPAYKNGLQAVLKIKKNGQRQTVFSQAGMLGSFGCNDSGLALCVNTVSQLGYDAKGLPVSYLVRRVLDSSSFEEAEELLLTIPHASGQNYLLGGNGQIGNYECSSNRVNKIKVTGTKYLCHTNHPIAQENLGLINEKAFFGSTSRVRYETLSSFLKLNSLKGVDKVVSGLFQEPVFISQENPTNGIATFHTVYFILEIQAQAFTCNLNSESSEFEEIF